MRHPSPLRYPGGKIRIFEFFDNLLYENNLIGTEYAEPYAGGGGLALKLLYGGYVSRLHLNDLDESIAAIWRAFLFRADELCDWITHVPVNVNSWYAYREIYLSPQNYTWMDLAKATFFLNRTSVSGVLKGAGIIGGKEQRGKNKIDARFNRDALCEKIRRIESHRELIEFSNLDALKFIKKLRKARSERVFYYLDPPYVQKGSALYMNHYVEKDHRLLASLVHELHGYWVVSYDVSETISKLYSRFSQIHYSLRQNTSNRLGDEVVIPSPSLDFSRSLGKLNDAEVCEASQDRENFDVLGSLA